jgi:lipoprotein
MKIFGLIILGMCLIASCATKQTAQQHNDSFINDEKVSKSTLIVYYDGAEGKANAVQAIRKMHAEILYDLKNMPILTIHLPEKTDIVKAKKQLEKVNGVLQVNYDRILQIK